MAGRPLDVVLTGALVGAVALGAFACGDGSNGASDDAAADDAGAERDDVVVPEDVRPEAEAEADADVDVDTAGDADAEAEADVAEDVRDADADVDGSTGLPDWCSYVWPTTDIAYGWRGRHSIDDGTFVWSWVEGDVTTLMARDLATGSDHELLRRSYPLHLDLPSVHGGSIFFQSRTLEEEDGEVFRIPVSGGAESQVTDDTDEDDGFVMAGHRYVVYYSYLLAPVQKRYAYSDATDGSKHIIASPTWGESEIGYDGHRWVAFTEDWGLYKFDLENPGDGYRQISTERLNTLGLAFDRDTGTLVASVVTADSDDLRLELWDMETEAMTVLLDEPWSQVIPDVDGHVVVYQDSQAAGERYGESMRSDLRVIDRDSHAIRVVMPLDTYYGVGIWERWIAFNNYGRYGDSLITCDLVAGGFLDADLHVIPE
jgi:hypothetical protein